MTRRLALLPLVALALGGATFAFAASLGVSAATLTTWSGGGGIAASTCTLPADADSWVDEGSGGNDNHGADNPLRIQNGNRTRRPFLHFDVASCVPAGARIVSADLSLYLANAPGASRTYDLRRVTGAWTEPGIVWNNQPGAAGTPTDSLATGTADGVWLVYDAAADVQAFAGGTANHGWRVSDANDANPRWPATIRSREAANNPPSLAIAFYP